MVNVYLRAKIVHILNTKVETQKDNVVSIFSMFLGASQILEEVFVLALGKTVFTSVQRFGCQIYVISYSCTSAGCTAKQRRGGSVVELLERFFWILRCSDDRLPNVT